MARASRRKAASPEPVEEEQEEVEQQDDEMEVEEETAQPLEFDEPLTWRAGRPLAVSELLRRLRTLHDELSAMDQFEVEDEAGRNAVAPKAKELGNAQLLSHRDKGVKAWTLACIVQMFRILAPNAPYTASQLRDIFHLVASEVIPALADPTGSYHQQYAEILSSLANLRSIVLVVDLPGSENLILALFTNCFDALSGNVRGGGVDQVAKTVQYNMTIALSAILQEGGKPSDGVLDVLLAQFLRADPETMKKSGAPPPRSLDDISSAYNVARSICSQCTEPLSIAIGNYYTSILINASEAPTKLSKTKGRKRTHDESEDESDDGMMTPPAELDFEDVEKAHRLLRELWRTSSDVIDGVVPQVTSEMKAENVQIRTLAVQTVGDMIAGIGAAGPPPPEPLDPAAYPSQSVQPATTQQQPENALFKPIAPHDFSSKYPDCYHEFLRRRSDRSPHIRSAWATAAARIVLTSGGNRGLDADQEANFLSGLADMLQDSDERVRLAAVQSIATFSYDAVISKLGRSGGVSTEKSLLNLLAARVKDPKPHVHTAAIELLARIWGVASGAIAEGSERARTLLGAIPSFIFSTAYINNAHIDALTHRVLYDSLLPITYPPIRPSKAGSQRVADSQNGSEPNLDPDTIRVERILTLIRDLDARAKPVFYRSQQQQAIWAKYMDGYLQTKEALTRDDDGSKASEKKRLATYIQHLANVMPDTALATEHLTAYSKHHDRRADQLIRFCYAADSDYRKITKAIKEFSKRLEEAPAPVPAVLDTMMPLLRSISILVFNQSHVTPMGNFARTNEKDLSATAHELLQVISNQRPEAFKVQAKEYVQTLKKQAPTAATPNDPEAVEILKSCAHFALRSPDDMPKDRDFYEAMSAFALHGSPPQASKHAITVIAASATKKDMYANDILKQCLETADYGSEHFLSKLAAISQISLLMSEETDEQSGEAVTGLAIGKILKHMRTPAGDDDPEWTDELDEEIASKIWALKILVNGIRGQAKSATEETKAGLRTAANPVFRLLNTLILQDGELSKSSETPKHHRSQLRLAAAVQLLKLSCTRVLDSFFTHADFTRLAKISQDPLREVRSGFVRTVKKYLGQGKLQPRFYGLVFMYAFEPNKEVKESTTTWLKARAAMASKANDSSIVQVFARFLSLLAHHQDFSSKADELEDFIEYIMFYLKCVANESNLPLIYHLAQRVKTVQDGIDASKSENLYILSDLAQAIIKRFQEEKGWSLQVYSTKARLPAGPFAQLSGHQNAQDISEKRYLPDELDEDVISDLVRASLKPKKRKAEGTSKPSAKKAKPSVSASAVKKAPVRKAPKPAKTPKKKIEDSIPESERRKSSRVSKTAKSYAEESGSEADDEPETWDKNGDEDQDKENIPSDTPPSSHPTPAAARASTQKAPARKLPTRGGRNGKAADIMDVPDDSDEELSEPPSDLEA